MNRPGQNRLEYFRKTDGLFLIIQTFLTIVHKLLIPFKNEKTPIAVCLKYTINGKFGNILYIRTDDGRTLEIKSHNFWKLP
jgi:hypothetical protein